MKNKWILFMLLLIASNAFAQYKFEKENRIRKADVPEEASSFVDAMAFDSKVKWFEEIGYDKTSYEAKTKRDGKKFSIEFSAEGVFEDVEIEIETNGIPKNTYSRITDYLSTEFQKYSFEKVQIQYTGDPDQVLAYFSSEATQSALTVNYEIVISTRIENSYVRFELLFSEEGNFIKKSKIVSKNVDNIIY
jgi:hypothetical protein